MLKRWILIFLLISGSAGAALAQDDEACSPEAITARMNTLIETYQTEVDTGSVIEQAQTLQTGIDGLMDECAPPLVTGLTLDDTGIPIESWVVVTADASEPMIQSAAKLYEIDDPSCFYAYLYIDHEVGISLKLEAFCELADDGTIKPLIGADPTEISLRIRYDGILTLNMVAMTRAQREALELPVQPEWVKTYLNDDHQVTRTDRRLDPLRAPGFPDDIQVLLMGPEGDSREIEQVWCRLEFQMSEDGFVCILLNEPYQDYDVTLGQAMPVDLTRYQGKLYAIARLLEKTVGP